MFEASCFLGVPASISGFGGAVSASTKHVPKKTVDFVEVMFQLWFFISYDSWALKMCPQMCLGFIAFSISLVALMAFSTQGNAVNTCGRRDTEGYEWRARETEGYRCQPSQTRDAKPNGASRSFEKSAQL